MDEIVWRMCASCFMALLRRPCWEENSSQSEKMYAWAHTLTLQRWGVKDVDSTVVLAEYALVHYKRLDRRRGLCQPS